MIDGLTTDPPFYILWNKKRAEPSFFVLLFFFFFFSKAEKHIWIIYRSLEECLGKKSSSSATNMQQSKQVNGSRISQWFWWPEVHVKTVAHQKVRRKLEEKDKRASVSEWEEGKVGQLPKDLSHACFVLSIKSKYELLFSEQRQTSICTRTSTGGASATFALRGSSRAKLR